MTQAYNYWLDKLARSPPEARLRIARACCVKNVAGGEAGFPIVLLGREFYLFADSDILQGHGGCSLLLFWY